ncbi:MAG: gliding motility protein GldN [Bacteroidia bacterium]
MAIILTDRTLHKLISIFFLSGVYTAFSQSIFNSPSTPKHPLDSQYKLYYKSPEKFDSLSEATVTLVNRVWRVIDLKEKGNYQLFGTTNYKKHYCNMYDVLLYGISKYKMFAYKDDDFGSSSKNKKFGTEEILKVLIRKDSVDERYIDENSGEDLVKKVLKHDTIKASDIVQYWVKEDWYYNKHNAALEKQVVSLCPVVLDEKRNKYRPLFWIYYPECRELLSSFEAYYPSSTGERYTFDQLIVKKSFNSYLIKETNVFDRKGSGESTGIDQLLESERAKEKYIRKEDKLWEY